VQNRKADSGQYSGPPAFNAYPNAMSVEHEAWLLSNFCLDLK